MPTTDLLQQYQSALDTAVQLATARNASPVFGSTLVLCDCGNAMMTVCRSAKGLGGVKRTFREVGALLALMCTFVCESCDLWVYKPGFRDGLCRLHSYDPADTASDSILSKLSGVLELMDTSFYDDTLTITGLLQDMLRDRVRIDHLLIITHSPAGTPQEDNFPLQEFLHKYRLFVNADLLRINVFLDPTTSPPSDSPLDVSVSGFSEQILRFMAERGAGNAQLDHVHNIDKVKGL
eukprot:CAMPEP_0184356490 /NCGR_PEP_ID=MMETSP1089-20130417/103089_1 /TAXON_ID=38269 ORGANISM="Gloeochaete wittrockiana, Strain SAG46.84" /NCGR_SAMPLE_ID=MMETSP1089 /ASSEMBLY_ACC=CAM_ASM_000445 /LENGTH=235 /DNA_ID=CAMNT_0026693761 /DNA_START=38 /DNA_END=742 /DNA_ORIENTATION=-